MTRDAPQVDRVVALFRLLAAEPAGQMSLSEIALRLGVHKVTLYPMLGTLEHAGFVVRARNTKKFSLGPALIPVGEAAARAFRSVDAGKQAVHTLHEELGLPCYLSTLSENCLTLVELADRGTLLEGTARLGHRQTIRYPTGLGVVAWLGDAAFDDWIRQADPDLDVATLRRSMAIVRERGYSVERRAGDVANVINLLKQMATHVLPGEERPMLDRLTGLISFPTAFVIDELLAHATYGVLTLDAPIFDAAGGLEMLITVVMPQHDNSGAQVRRAGETLAATVSGISPLERRAWG